MKEHILHMVRANYKDVQYFYKKEKRDINGNSRFRVFVIDDDGLVYENIVACYECEIEKYVTAFCECDL